MHRFSFLLYPAMLAVILVGLLIFFTQSTAVLFLREQIFNTLSIAITPLNSLRVWSHGGTSPQADTTHLQEQLIQARATLQQLASDNNRLRSALNFKEKNKLHLLGASVRTYGYEMGREFLIIDRGVHDGIIKGSFVINESGLVVGMVDTVENNFSKVGIASNTKYVFDAELLPLNINVFAKGLGNRTFLLDILPQHSLPHVGDFVMARTGNISFLMGEIVRVEMGGTGVFKEVRAILLSHPENEKEVFIVMADQ